ncbi:MAG: metallophosphoesterase [Clostridia bacterium]|nr:metallophosphoesterase [Clostridia bacterium]
MKAIKIDLPEDLEGIQIKIFGDEHIGDEHSDLKRLKERIEYVANTKSAYCVLNGDLIDNATKTSIGDTYAAEFNPMQQLKTAVELFEPIKDKIIAITHGNHEARTYRKEGIDLSYLLAAQLGLTDRYTPTSALLFIRLGKASNGRKKTNDKSKVRKICYTIYMLHGSGGGRKEGAKAIRLADMASIVDADIYIHNHTHLPMVMREGFYRTDVQNSTFAMVDKLFVNGAANLNYGGYGEAQEFKPASKQSPVIYLNGTKKEMSAKL